MAYLYEISDWNGIQTLLGYATDKPRAGTKTLLRNPSDNLRGWHNEPDSDLHKVINEIGTLIQLQLFPQPIPADLHATN